MLQVLFIDCGDLKNVLKTVVAQPKNNAMQLQIHINETCGLSLARNILLLSIFERFSVRNDDDIAYLWEVTNFANNFINLYFKKLNWLLSVFFFLRFGTMPSWLNPVVSVSVVIWKCCSMVNFLNELISLKKISRFFKIFGGNGARLWTSAV